MSAPLDVLIVGAGPTGLALACHLRRLGLAVRVLDKKAGPSTTSKALGLQYRVSEILAVMGVVDRFLARGSVPGRLNMFNGASHLVTLKVAGLGVASGREAFAPRAIMLPQSETEELLLDLLRERDGRVEWGTEFVAFEQGPDGVVSHVRRADGSEEDIASAWLVSCEGAHSVIRKQAGMTFAGKSLPQTFYMADVELDWPREHNEHYIFFHREGSVGVLSLPRPKTFRLFIEMPEGAELPAEGLTIDLVRDLVRRRLGEPIPTISNPTWLSEFRISCRMVDHYRNGRVFLAGDAAHIHSPQGGQGIVTGIQDATNLAWKLARVQAGAPEALLDTYEEERLPKAREVLHETNKMADLFIATRGPRRWLRDYLLLPLMRMDWFQKMIFAKMAQLHVGYRGGRLSRHDDGRWFGGARLKAGDRAPDVAFRTTDGAVTTLFRLLEPLRPVALIGTEPATDAAAVERLLARLAEADVAGYVLGPLAAGHPRGLGDVHGDFKRFYGMTGEFLCLIRPDDHIGLFQRPIRPDRLEEYLGLIASK